MKGIKRLNMIAQLNVSGKALAIFALDKKDKDLINFCEYFPLMILKGTGSLRGDGDDIRITIREDGGVEEYLIAIKDGDPSVIASRLCDYKLDENPLYILREERERRETGLATGFMIKFQNQKKDSEIESDGQKSKEVVSFSRDDAF